MQIADSDPTLDGAATVGVGPKRAARARRAEALSAKKASEIQPLPRWARPRGGDPGAAAFAAGAGLALFDQVLRGGPDGAEPPFAGCLRQRLALRAAESCATLCRLREDAGALRDAEHLAGGAETSPAGRLHRPFGSMRRMRRALTRRASHAAAQCLACARSTPTPLPWL